MKVHFFAGETRSYVQIPVVDDALLETEETFLLRLMMPIKGIVQEPYEAIVTIFDDECK